MWKYSLLSFEKFVGKADQVDLAGAEREANLRVGVVMHKLLMVIAGNGPK